MKLDFISVFVSLALLSFITSVLCQGKSRRLPLEGSGSGVGPGVDDEDQLQTGSFPRSPLKPSPSDRRKGATLPLDNRNRNQPGLQEKSFNRNELPVVRRPTAGYEAKRRLMRPTSPTKPLRMGRPAGQQGDEGSGQLPPDLERPSSYPKMPRKELSRGLPNAPRRELPPGMHQVPLTCKDVLARGTMVSYDPKCDKFGNYKRRQCKGDSCMCVNVNTGVILEQTTALRVKNISCVEVKYIIQLPFRVGESPQPSLAMRIRDQLHRLLDNLIGRQKLSFKGFIPSAASVSTGIEFSCVSIGHTNPEELRPFLAGLLQRMAVDRSLSTDVRRLNVTIVGGRGRNSKRISLLPEVQPPEVKVDPPRKPGEQSNAGEDRPSAPDDSRGTANDEGKNAASMGQNKKSGAAAFLQQPGIIAAIIGGGIAGFFLAILLILFCIYRIRKKDEGSYALEEPKKMPVSAAVYHSAPTREYYA